MFMEIWILVKFAIAIGLFFYFKDTPEKDEEQQRKVAGAVTWLSLVPLLPFMLVANDEKLWFSQYGELIHYPVIWAISFLAWQGKFDYQAIPGIILTSAIVDFFLFMKYSNEY